MPRRFHRPIPDDLREPHEVDVPGLWNVYIVAIGIAILLGLVGGSAVDRLAAAELLVSPADEEAMMSCHGRRI